MKTLILGIWLGIQGYIDLRYKEIPLWFSALGAMLGIVFCIIERRDIVSVLLACMPGFMMLVFSKLTREVIGYGDGIVLVVMGIFLSLESLLSTGMTAFTIAGVVALVLLVGFKKRGSHRIPFIPFLSVAYGIECLTKIGGSGI